MDLAKVDKILPLCRYVPLDIRLPLSKEPLSAMTSNNMMGFFIRVLFYIFSPTQMKRKVPTPILFQLHVYFNSILIRELRVCKFSQNCVKEWMCKERLNLKSTHDLTFLKCVDHVTMWVSLFTILKIKNSAMIVQKESKYNNALRLLDPL